MRRYWVEAEHIHLSEPAPAAPEAAAILPVSAVSLGEVYFEGETFHHVCEVCRMQKGSHFEVLSSGGAAFFVEMQDVGRKRARAIILEKRDIEPVPRPWIHLVLSIPRFNKVDWILEKAVELGVHTVRPFVSDFSFIKKSDLSESKLQRWQKIILSATQQSGRGDWLEVAPVADFQQILQHFNRATNAVGLFAYEGQGDLDLGAALKSMNLAGCSEVWVFVGSEGGFSDQEVASFRQIGLQPVTLGRQVLRVETACLALVSVIKYESGLMR